MRNLSFWRGVILLVALLSWGYPLSVLGRFAGLGEIPGWIAGILAVQLVELACFLWWRDLARAPVPVRVRSRR